MKLFNTEEDLLDNPADISEMQDAKESKCNQASSKKKKKKSEAKVGRCILCRTYVKIDKRTKNYFGESDRALCDICLIHQESPDYDYRDELEVELELELLRNPSGRNPPKLYEE